MKKMETKTNKMFGELELTNLQNLIPGKYYIDFQRIWNIKHKSIKCPNRQNVYGVLHGKSENDKILEVLIEIVKERKELWKELKSVTSND